MNTMLKSTMRRAWLCAASLTLLSLALPFNAGYAAPSVVASTGQHWVGSWGAAPAGPALAAAQQRLTDQTVRLIVHTSLAGSEVRVRLSNQYGTVPLVIGAAHIARRAQGAAILADSDRALRFGGAAAVSIAPGATILSDPVALAVPALSDLAVSLYLPNAVEASTLHELSYQTNYVSPSGDFSAAPSLPIARTIAFWPFLTDVQVSAPRAGAIVALGDSITDGAITTRDANQRWPDVLALRLQGAGKGLGVVNRGISGNRLLRDASVQPLFGLAALRRFESDVLATAGLKYLIVLIGINDIGHPGSGAIPATEAVTLQDLVAGYQQLIARAHARGIKVYGATLTPFENTLFRGYYTVEKETLRQAVNHWIRSSNRFDAVIDADLALRDPLHPARLLPAYDSGDHLHPNAAGAQALAQAIDLGLFIDVADADADADADAGLPSAPL